MTTQDETAALVNRLEAVLKRLEVGNGEFPGACCGCLQDVPIPGHLPSCCIDKALQEIVEWKAWSSKSRS